MRLLIIQWFIVYKRKNGGFFRHLESKRYVKGVTLKNTPKAPPLETASF
ncbi:hypothetical protein [Pseudoruminococcus massiliensis]|nr:hypothetical protein [Pseudoruminococcus massiliensis]